MSEARDRNRAFYDRFAEGETPYWRYMPAPKLRRRRIVEWIVRLAPESVGDLGCGNGALLAEIKRALPGVKLFGVDLSGEQIAKNRAAWPEISWIEADAQEPGLVGKLPFRPGVLVSSEVIEHLDRPDSYLANARESLAPGGALILTTQSGPVRATERHVGHVRHFSAEEMAKLLKESGFPQVRAWNEGFPFHDLSKWAANLDPEKTIQGFDTPDYGPAQKLVAQTLSLLFHFNSRTRGAQVFAVARAGGDADADALNQHGSTDRFGFEWDEYSRILPEHEEQFLRWLPFVTPRDWKGKSFLDVGCGMGRNSFWPLSYGASTGKAVDLDERSLAAAQKNLASFENAEVARESAYELTDENRFDVVFSIGVIHHLGDPGRAVRRMARAARPGGLVAVWLYGYENNEWIVDWFDPLRKALFSRLPIRMVHGLSLFPAAGLFAALRAGLGKTAYMDLLRGFTFPHVRAIVFDQMLPTIARYYKEAEVRALMEGAGLTDVRLAWVNEMSWAACGRKPEAD